MKDSEGLRQFRTYRRNKSSSSNSFCIPKSTGLTDCNKMSVEWMTAVQLNLQCLDILHGCKEVFFFFYYSLLENSFEIQFSGYCAATQFNHVNGNFLPSE